MATQLIPLLQPGPRDPVPANVVVEDDASTVELRAFARHYVSVLLELEGVRVTPATIADSHP